MAKGGKKESKSSGGGLKNTLKKIGKTAVHGAKVASAASRLGLRLANPVNRAKFVANAVRGEGFVLPGSKYIGPGNRMDKGKPVNEADANAYQHDIDYDNYLKKGHKAFDVYTGYSDADERLLKNTKATTPEGLAVVAGMGIKKGLNKLGLTKRIRDTDRPSIGAGSAGQPRVAAKGNPSASGVKVRRMPRNHVQMAESSKASDRRGVVA